MTIAILDELFNIQNAVRNSLIDCFFSKST